MCDNSQVCGMSNPKTFSDFGPDVDLRGHTGNCNHNTDIGATAETTFYNKTNEWVDTLAFESAIHGNSNYDDLVMIGHVGFYDPDPGSCHCIGKAGDITKILWNGTDSQPCDGDHAASGRTRRRRYLAVDASCRNHFKWVLDGWFDVNHTNHIHVSAHYPLQSTIVLDKNACSDVVFVQAVCNNFNSAGIDIDGAWGTQTQAAFNNINLAWDFSVAVCDPFTSHDAYVDWLHRVMIGGFQDIGASQVSIDDGCNFPPRRRAGLQSRLHQEAAG